MAIPLLTTKFYIPPVRPELVPRPRLIERLNAGLGAGCKLVLVSAPPGFGKTTLLGEWAAGCGCRAAWLALDKADNDPARFWAYIIAALQAVCPGVGQAALEALHAARTEPPHIESLLTELVNEIAELEPVALILDDYHLITAPQINSAMMFLLGNLPPNFHLVIAGRADPPWALARLRSRREVVELRVGDLRFMPDEVATFLNHVMKLDLSAELVAALDARTEGWAAGLQMAALSMQGQDRAAFVRAFSGSHRYILDYLVEEVLERQPGDVQDFMLKTSILEQMTALLCDAVTSRNDSSAILARLDKSNLFLVALDDQRRWYRYHHLFADLLISRLRQATPDQVPALHCRASEWHESSGLLTEAVTHALAAEDTDRAARLIEGNALALMDHGELTTLAEWLGALPPDVIAARPWLCVARAWALLYAGQLAAIEALLGQAEKGLPPAVAEARHIQGHIAAIRSYHVAMPGNLARSADYARQALELLPVQDLMARGMMALMLAIAQRRAGDLASASETYAQAIAISQAGGDSHVNMLTRCNLAGLRRDQGRLTEAAAMYRELIRPADDRAGRPGNVRLPIAGLACTNLTFVLAEWNDLDTAWRYVREGIEISKRWGHAEFIVSGYLRLAELALVMGDAPGVAEAMRIARQHQQDLPWIPSLEALEAELDLRLGNVASAARWAQDKRLSARDAISYADRLVYFTFARLLYAQGRYAEASTVWARLLSLAESCGALDLAIRLLAMQSLTLQAQGQDELARVTLRRALTLAQPEGYVRSFVDEGEPLRLLIADLRLWIARQSRSQDQKLIGYVDKLLAAFAPAASMPQPGIVNLKPALAEPLSERELEVLRFLTTDLSTPEIAQELVVSANTVRSHIKNIYGKLNVHNRIEAIQQAKTLGLV